MRDIPPSKHSSRKKNLKLCRSMGDPMYEPHIFDNSMHFSFSTSENSAFPNCSLIKSKRLLPGGILSLLRRLYSNASSIVVHMKSEILPTKPSSRGSPDVSITFCKPPHAWVIVFEPLLRSRMGLFCAPCIQFGPL